MSRLHIWYGGMSQKLYAQKLNKNGGTVGERWEVTQEAVNAVMQYMHVTGQDFECKVGELIFKPKAIETTE